MALQNAFGNLSTEEKQDAILTELQKKADGNETQPVSVVNPIDVSGLATSLKQLPDNHLVTVSNIASTPLITGFSTDINQTNGSQKTQIVETTPTDTTKLNPSVSITESVLGTVTTKTIQKTIGTDVYQKTIATDSSNNSISISAWGKL